MQFYTHTYTLVKRQPATSSTGILVTCQEDMPWQLAFEFKFKYNFFLFIFASQVQLASVCCNVCIAYILYWLCDKTHTYTYTCVCNASKALRRTCVRLRLFVDMRLLLSYAACRITPIALKCNKRQCNAHIWVFVCVCVFYLYLLPFLLCHFYFATFYYRYLFFSSSLTHRCSKTMWDTREHSHTYTHTYAYIWCHFMAHLES